MTHLGTQLSALADGQLGPAAAERAMAHVAACQDCADGLAAAHAARRALASAFEVRPTADLTARLLALGAQQPGLPQASHSGSGRRPVSPDPAAPWADRRCVPLPDTRGRLPLGGLRGDVRPRRLPVVALAAGTLGVGLVAVLFVLGGEPMASPDQHPARALGLLSRAADAVGAQQLTFTVVVDDSVDPSARLVAATALLTDPAYAWAEPVPIPEGYRIAAVRTQDRPAPAVEVDLVGPHGLLVVTQTLARLDERAVGGVATQIGDRTVLVLSRSPWQAVWQSGDVMVDIVAEVPSGAVSDLVSAASVHAYDDGAQARLVRGWQTLVASWRSP